MPETVPWWRDRLNALALEPRRLVVAATAVAVVLVAAAVAVALLRGSPPPVHVELPRAAPGEGREAGASAPEPEAPADALVHAAGAVARPGVYRIRPGGRVADVVEAAGGAAPDADLQQLNLAAKVSDGERVYVPRRGEVVPSPAPSGPAGPAGTATGPIDLNTATAEQLEALPGVGPSTAQAILDYRRQHGRFRTVDELLEVRGIGEAKLAALRPRVRV